MPQRNYSREHTNVAKPNKRAILPIGLEEYQELSGDSVRFRAWLDSMIAAYPELFPAEIAEGYELHDTLPLSRKLPGVRFRRIKLKAKDSEGKQTVLTIASSAVMPFMTGLTQEVEKALFLRQCAVPFWALTYVLGRDDSYWYRMTAGFGRLEIVSTTVKDVAKLPEHLLADEKHVHFNGEKGYIATTVGDDCVLGASLALSADEAALTQAYSGFREEARHLRPEYAPKTVNTDGWQATYHAKTPTDFCQQIADFLAWSRQSVSGTALEAIEKLCAKQDTFLLAFDFPDAYRTSNLIDRHMDPMDRWLVSAHFFHGHASSAELQIRSWAILHNFWPYRPVPASKPPTESNRTRNDLHWDKGGCVVTMPTSIGARIRYQLDRESDAYKLIYKQRTADERVNSQALELGIERPKLRNGAAITNQNTLTYVLINLRGLHRVRAHKAELTRQEQPITGR